MMAKEPQVLSGCAIRAAIQKDEAEKAADRENDFNQAVRLLKLINKELQNLPPTSTQLFNSEISESINKFAEKYT